MTQPGRMSTDTGIDLSFLSCTTPGGYLESEPLAVLKDIAVPGVDFNRQRFEHFQFPVFQMRTLAEAFDYDKAIGLAVFYDRMVGHLVKLAVTIRGIEYTFPNVMVLPSETRPRLVKGACLGADVTAGYTSGVLHSWKLQCTELVLP